MIGTAKFWYQPTNIFLLIFIEFLKFQKSISFIEKLQR